jgi:hypothetical protein
MHTFSRLQSPINSQPLSRVNLRGDCDTTNGSFLCGLPSTANEEFTALVGVQAMHLEANEAQVELNAIAGVREVSDVEPAQRKCHIRARAFEAEASRSRDQHHPHGFHCDIQTR